MVLIMNKNDETENVKVSEEEVSFLASNLNIVVFKTSVKNNVNVLEPFDYLATEFINRS